MIGLLSLILWGGVVNASPVFIHVFDAPAGHSHSKKVLSILKTHSSYTVKLNPVYSPLGELTNELFQKAVSDTRKHLSTTDSRVLVHLSFNLRSTDKTRGIEEALADLLRAGAIIVGPGGENPDNVNLPLKLSDTVLGKVKGIFIVGELSPKGFLAPRANYGPEMLTALLPPKGLHGSSYAAPLLTIRLATSLLKTKPLQVISDLELRKKKSQSGFPSFLELGL